MSERTLHKDTKSALAENVVRPAILVYADFPAGEIRMWSGLGPLTVDGETWTGVGNLLGIEDVTETLDTGAGGMAVQLAGMPSEIFNRIEMADYQNRRATVAMLVFDSEGEAVGAPITLFSGMMDSDTVKDSGGEVSVTIALESALSDQLRPRVFRYDHEDQQTRYPQEEDKGLEFVASLQNLELKWGEK